MSPIASSLRRLWASALCVMLAIWSATPSYSHAPAVFDTIQDHLEMIEDHGHSHGFTEDLMWAMHGHSHDAADHDHSQAFLLAEQRPDVCAVFTEPWRCAPGAFGPSPHFPIKRPPRV